MKFILNKDKLTIKNEETQNSGSVKYYEADVEFDESWEELTIEARLVEREGEAYADEGKGIAVINGKVFIDNELSGSFGIGFVGYKIEDNAKVYQISSEIQSIWFNKGAGEIETVEGELPTPSQWEIYLSQIQEFIDNGNEIIEEANTLNLEASKEEGIASITITKKDGTKESVDINDGEKGGKGDKGDTYTITSADYNAIATIVKGQITIPTKLSELTNDTGFITDIVNTLTNYYLKTDTYTKTEVNNLIGQVSTISIVKVNTLPVQGQSNIIYLVPNNSGEEQDIFDEYLWIDNAFEKIGNTKIDLTGYATEEWVTGQISNFLTSSEITTLVNTALANYYTKTQTDTLLSHKADNTTLLDYMQKSEAKVEHDRIINQFPKGSTNTNPAYMNDSVDLPLNKFSLEGKTEQDSTTGANIFDLKKFLSDRNVSYTENADGSLTFTTAQGLYSNPFQFSETEITVSLSGIITSSINTRIELLNSNNEYVGNITPSIDKTQNKIASKLRMNFPEYSIVTMKNIMLNTGSTALDYELYTGGIPSPNPNYPQKIKNVEGKNKASLKTSAEKIMRNLSFTVEEGIIKINGTTDSSTPTTFDFDSFRVKSSGIATLWTEIKGYTDQSSANATVLLKESSDNSSWTTITDIDFKSTSTHQKQVTLDSSKYYRIVWYTGTGNVFTNAEIKIQLEYGTTKTSFVPANCIQIKKCNANLWDEQWELGQYNTTTGAKADSDNTIRNKNPIYCLADTQYYVCINNNIDNSKVRLLYYDKNGNLLSTLANIRNTIITTPQNTAYINLMFNTSYGTTYNNDVCINLSDNQINGRYIAHLEKTYNFPLSEGQVLMQNGTIEDKVVNEWNEIEFDGSDDENWSYDGGLSGKSCFYHSISDVINLPDNTDNKIRITCNKFIGLSASELFSRKPAYSMAIISNKRLYLLLNDASITTSSAFKTWLSNNPITVEYELATPDETAFTPEQQAVIDEIIKDGTYKEVTHIEATASINPNMEIGYYKTQESAIDEAIEELDVELSTVAKTGNYADLLNRPSVFQLRTALASNSNLNSLLTGIYEIRNVAHNDFPVSGAMYGVLIQFSGEYKPQLFVAGGTGECQLYYRRWLTASSSYTPWANHSFPVTTEISASSTDDEFPTAKAVYDYINSLLNPT